MNQSDHRLLRIGVFYDGNFLFHVSNYYRFAHPRKRRLSIPGLHDFIRQRASEIEGIDVRNCQIVDAHFFRGRLSAREAEQRQKLYAERVFDDILMGQGVVTHYLPMRRGFDSGIDVWLALEAFELTVHKRFNLLVIIGGDTDYIPLVQKVNSLGTRVMLLGWDFKFTDEQGRERETVTSARLCNKVSYPIRMNEVIGEDDKSNDPLINGLFGREPGPEDDEEDPPLRREGGKTPVDPDEEPVVMEKGATGSILSIMTGYAFIESEDYPKNVFFHNSQAVGCDFSEFREGDEVVFDAIENARGIQAMNVEKR